MFGSDGQDVRHRNRKSLKFSIRHCSDELTRTNPPAPHLREAAMVAMLFAKCAVSFAGRNRQSAFYLQWPKSDVIRPKKILGRSCQISGFEQD